MLLKSSPRLYRMIIKKIKLFVLFSLLYLNGNAQIEESARVSFTHLDSSFITFGNFLVKEKTNCLILASGIDLIFIKSRNAFINACFETPPNNLFNYSINIYPNPFIEYFIIKVSTLNTLNVSESVSLQVYTIDGKAVYKKQVSLQDLLNGLRVYLPNIPSGTYVATFSLKDKYLAYKLIKFGR